VYWRDNCTGRPLVPEGLGVPWPLSNPSTTAAEHVYAAGRSFLHILVDERSCPGNVLSYATEKLPEGVKSHQSSQLAAEYCFHRIHTLAPRNE
jgi:hypothetical protein